MPVMEQEKSSLSSKEIKRIAEKSIQNDKENQEFKRQVSRYLNNFMQQQEVFKLGTTPLILKELGSKAPELIMYQDSFNNATKKSGETVGLHSKVHNIPLNAAYDLAEKIREPILVLKGNPKNPNSVVMLTELENENGGKILAPISLDRKNGTVNVLNTLYAKDNATDELGNIDVKRSLKNYLSLHKDEILAINTEKAEELYKDIGLQLPSLNTILCFDNSIAYTTANVKYPEQESPEITHFHNPVEHNKLLPILNAKADFHESRLETLKDKRDTRTTKIERNEVKITKLSLKADKLEDLNKMFSSLSERSNVFKAIVARNEQKINAIRNEKIPARQQKIKNHQNRIAEIDRKSEIIGHKLEICVALSDTVKSFAVIGAERRQRFATAMDKLNQSTLACLNDKKAALVDKLESQTQKYNAPETAISAKSDIQNSINKCNTQIADLDNKISTLSQNHATYAKKSEAEIDTVMQNTANAVQTSLETGEISVAAISEKACLTAAQENPFEYLKNAEMAMEDDYNSIDGIINNGKREEPPQENNISQSETDKGTNTVEDTKEKRYINPDYYKSLKAADRAILAVSAVEAQRLMNKLNENKIPFSAVKSGTNLKITVSNSNKDKTYELLNADKAKFLNPEFYKNLDKKERFTQRMDEKSARAVVGELRKNDIEHSAVLNGDKSAVTIKQSDYPKVTSFQISRNFLKKRTEEKHKASPKEVKNKDRGERS